MRENPRCFGICHPLTYLPAGEYFVGDPCYVIRGNDWDDALRHTAFFNLWEGFHKEVMRTKDERNGVFVADGKHLFAVSSTHYGDGVYPAFESNLRGNGTVDLGCCGVDSGTLAAVPMNMLEPKGTDKRLRHKLRGLGLIYRFKHDFRIWVHDGTVGFGDILIPTKDDDFEYVLPPGRVA